MHIQWSNLQNAKLGEFFAPNRFKYCEIFILKLEARFIWSANFEILYFNSIAKKLNYEFVCIKSEEQNNGVLPIFAEYNFH